MILNQLFRIPSSINIAKNELETSKRELLIMQATAEHSAKMVEYYQGAIKRLTGYIQKEAS